jgi:ubiquinone/menaquinone biosynthesis C-methylase UbiE
MAARPANFDLIARPYRSLEYLTFGPYLERCRFYFLDQLTTHRRALILGDGDGRFTVRLLAANPEVAADAVDSSAAMLQLLTNRLSNLGPGARKRLKAIHSDALTFTPEGGNYDLVVTHFFLDCFTEDDLTPLLARIKPHLASGATWLVSEFAIPKDQPAAYLSRLVLFVLYRAFRIATGLNTQRLPAYAPLFRQNGLSLSRQKSFLGGLLVSELWKFDSEK